MSMAGLMASPMEHREVMRAAFHFGGDGRSVEDVLAAQRQRRAERAREHKSPTTKGAKRTPEPVKQGTVRQSELDKMFAMLGRRPGEAKAEDVESARGR